MDYRPTQPHGRRISSDPYFTLMANSDGVGFVHCGDGVLVVPSTGDGEVLMAVERSPAFDREVLLLVGGEVEKGKSSAASASLVCLRSCSTILCSGSIEAERARMPHRGR